MTIQNVGKPHKERKALNGNAEARIQAAIVAWIRMAAPECVVAAIPNGGLRSKREASLMKWTGTLAGMPDLIVLAPQQTAFFIECKTPEGRLSIEQQDMIFRLSGLGFSTAVCRSIDDARLAFKAWNILTRETVPA